MPYFQMKRFVVLVFALVTFYTALSFGQEPIEPEPDEEADEIAQPPDPHRDEREIGEKRKKIEERIETMKMLSLMDELKLSQEEVLKIFPKIQAFDREREAGFKDGKSLIMKLREALEKGTKDEKQLREILDNLETHRSKMHDLEKKHFQEMSALFSVDQMARYVLFNIEFKNRIHRIIEESRQPERFRHRAPRKNKQLPNSSPEAPERPEPFQEPF